MTRRRSTAGRRGEKTSAHRAGLIEQSTGVHLQLAAIPLFTSTIGLAVYSTVLHKVTTADPTTAELAAALHTLVTVALTMAVWHHVGPKHIARRVATSATVAWHGGAATVLTITGPWHWPWAMVWLAGSVVCGGYWVLRQWTRALGAEDGEGHDHTADQVAELAALGKARIGKAQVTDGGTVRAPLALPPGLTVRKTLADTAEAVASAADLPESAARIIPDPGSARRGILEIDTVDNLAAALTWPGASRPGASIGAAPLLAGRYGTGEPVHVNLTGCPNGSSEHVLVTGMTGAGKTDGVVGLVADGLTRAEVTVLVLDGRKGEQSYGHLKPYLWLETDPARCRQIMRRLGAVITARTAHLGARGLKEWRPGCGLTYLIAVLEEAYDLVRDGKYDGVALAARSAGITLVSSIQRATFDQMSTTWRAQHGAFWCFGVASADDASYGLPDALAGQVHPEVWRKSRPGYSYLGGAGIEDDQAQRPLRSYDVTSIRGDLARYLSTVRAHHGLSVDLDPVTAAAFGDLWQTRAVHADPHAGQTSTVDPATLLPAAAVPANTAHAAGDVAGEDEDQDDDAERDIADAAEDLADHLADAAAAELAELPEDDRATIGPVRPADPALAAQQLPADDSPALAHLDPAAGPVRGHGAIRSAWLAWVAELHRTGRKALDRQSAVAWAAEHGRSDSWADEQLRLLVDAEDAHRHPDHRGVILLDREPVDPFADLFSGAAL